MSRTEQNYGADEEPFSLTVDQYGRVWLHTKIEGIEVAIDLAEKNAAFDIMAVAMAEHGFEHRPVQRFEPADNDDETSSWRTDS